MAGLFAFTSILLGVLSIAGAQSPVDHPLPRPLPPQLFPPQPLPPLPLPPRPLLPQPLPHRPLPPHRPPFPYVPPGPSPGGANTVSGLGQPVFPGGANTVSGLGRPVFPTPTTTTPKPTTPKACSSWCNTKINGRIEYFCCDNPPAQKPGVCPPVRTVCPVYDAVAAPNPCINDYQCDDKLKCCFDNCLGHKTCKPALPI